MATRYLDVASDPCSPVFPPQCPSIALCPKLKIEVRVVDSGSPIRLTLQPLSRFLGLAPVAGTPTRTEHGIHAVLSGPPAPFGILILGIMRRAAGLKLSGSCPERCPAAARATA
ncbi:hypothetical protein NDU88_006805 [Pleurodeles waltl]|uniref:Uncharacterized protein n=1 Tax=Pleurodeles waltl TaxID=8319 RepID=A0AAV7MEH1_PLEWA|nr:hypothetical protein NDU88_006805 [Pleurodeles waltl]